MKNLLILTLIFVSSLANAQKVDFISKNDTVQKPKSQQFVFLFAATNIADAIFVAKIKSSGNLKNIMTLFESLKSATQKIGANAFVVEGFTKIDNENGELTLSAYFCEDKIIEDNYFNMPKNKVYIFGNQDMVIEKKQTFKVDGIKYEIENGKYAVFPVEIGKEIKINKGGFAGMTFWFTAENNKTAAFLSFTGLGIGGGNYNPAFNQVGISFNTGRINRVDQNFALALLKIYTEQK